MTVAAQIPLPVGNGAVTITEFSKWAPPEDNPGKWELIEGFIVYAINEGKPHAQVKMGLIGELTQHLPPGLPCQPMADGFVVEIDERNGLIPDASIWCGDAAEQEQPVVIFEVAGALLSNDLTNKRTRYFRIPSLRAYCVLDVANRVVWLWGAGDVEATKVTSGQVPIDLPHGEISLNFDALWAYL